MNAFRAALAVSLLLFSPSAGRAIEGGTQTYLLGIRDSLAGIVPPPGVYFNNDLVLYSGDVPQLVIGGVGIINPDLSVALWRPNVTYVVTTQHGYPLDSLHVIRERRIVNKRCFYANRSTAIN